MRAVVRYPAYQVVERTPRLCRFARGLPSQGNCKLWLLTILLAIKSRSCKAHGFFLYTVSAYACTSEYYTSSYVQMNPIPSDLSGDCMQQCETAFNFDKYIYCENSWTYSSCTSLPIFWVLLYSTLMCCSVMLYSPLRGQPHVIAATRCSIHNAVDVLRGGRYFALHYEKYISTAATTVYLTELKQETLPCE